MTNFERKVYRIIFNMTHFGKNPSMEQLKPGKMSRRSVLKTLAQQGFFTYPFADETFLS